MLEAIPAKHCYSATGLMEIDFDCCTAIRRYWNLSCDPLDQQFKTAVALHRTIRSSEWTWRRHSQPADKTRRRTRS